MLKIINAIISNNPKTKTIEFNGIVYKNQTPTNLYIWYYKK